MFINYFSSLRFYELYTFVDLVMRCASFVGEIWCYKKRTAIIINLLQLNGSSPFCSVELLTQ